jgi:N-acetylneuraminate lyase
MDRIKGIIPAVFTPLTDEGEVDIKQIKPFSEFLIKDGVSAIYVCGSTGEGPLLTTPERQTAAKAFIEAVAGRVPVIVQVGHNSIKEAVLLAKQAAKAGADAISAVSPTYFKLNSLEILIECMTEIASAAPDLPFYYYHIPQITGVDFDMIQFLEEASGKIPNLRGIKYSAFTIFEMQACRQLQNEKFELFFGSDEMLLSALAVGIEGAVGSTFNFATPLYMSIIKAFKEGNLQKAQALQYKAFQMVRILVKYGGQPAFKATMKLIDMDCGPNLLPHHTLDKKNVDSLRNELENIGFFQWARNES